MSLFDKFKKKPKDNYNIQVSESHGESSEALNSANSSIDTESQATELSGAIMGVLDVFPLINKQDIVVTGRIKGTVNVGDAVYITNCGDDDAPTFLTTILSIETAQGVKATDATDCIVGLCVERGALFNIKKGTVLYSGECSSDDIRNAYINALGDVFVGKQRLEISDKDMEKLSLADLAEIWHLFVWHQSQLIKNKDENMIKQYGKRQETLVEAICKKLLSAKEVYCIYSKATGEPYMFSQTIKQDNGYMCTPPHILLFTKSMSKKIMSSLSEEKYGVMPIKNGEDGRGIYNFLGNVFYVNGANEVAIQVHHTNIPAQMLVPKPDYSNTDPKNIPITNPDVVRWLLLMGQIGTPKGEDEELVYRLYYRFMTKAIRNAKLLIPMQHDGQLKGDEDGNTVLKKDVQIKIPTRDGKEGRKAVHMYTDWVHLRMAYGEGWSGMVESIDNMINIFDCIVNVTKYPLAGCYISKEAYEEMKKF